MSAMEDGGGLTPDNLTLASRLNVVVSILEKHGDMIAVATVKDAIAAIEALKKSYSLAMASRIEWRHAAETNERRALAAEAKLPDASASDTVEGER